MLNPPDTGVIGDTLPNDVTAVIVDDERVGTRSDFVIGDPMPGGESPVFYQPYTGGTIPPGALVMTEAVAIASGYTSMNVTPNTTTTNQPV